MARPRRFAAHLAARLVPARYRAEVLGDIADAGHDGWAEVRAIVRSAVDARRGGRRDRRDDSWTPPGSGWAGDLIAAVRHLRRRPRSGAWIVATLSAAIAVSLALFAVVNSVLLRPLPYADPSRLAFLWGTHGTEIETLPPGRALDARARLGSIEGAALIGHLLAEAAVTGLGPAERWHGASVSSSFFDVLGARAEVGSVFHAVDADRNVVVLSHRLWVDRFGADPGAVGRSVTLNGRARRIVGVMAADFFWPSITSAISAADPPLLWSSADATDVPERPVPLSGDVTKDRTSGYLRMVARLRPGVGLATLNAEAESVAAALGREYPDSDGGHGLKAIAARAQLLGSIERPLWLVWIGSLLVVVGATVTVANLSLAGQSGRRREFAVRAALGAGRWQLARQLLAEAVVLASAAGFSGLAGAAALRRVLVAVAPIRVGRLDLVVIDAHVATLAIALTGGTAALLGGVAVAAQRREIGAENLRGAGVAVPSGARLRAALVALEIALAMVLAISIALFGESLLRLEAVDVGFDTRHLLTFEIALNGERAEYQARQLDFFDRLLARIRALPGVTAAAGAVTLPVGGDDWGSGFLVEGQPLPPPGHERNVGFQVVGSGWFETLGMRLVRGRDFRPSDTRQSPPVVIINETLAAEAFPGEDPLGRRVKYAREADAPTLTIIGVVSDIRHLGPAAPPRPEIYQAYHQFSQPMMAVAVRGVGDPLPLMPAIRAAAAEIDPTQPLSAAATMDQHLQRAYGDARFLSTLTSMFGALGLLLAVVGVYGVTSVGVAQRTRELGVRTALGAGPGRLAREVIRRGLAPIVAGAMVGTVMAAVLARTIRALLFGTGPLDASAYTVAAAVLVMTAAIASWLPARRAGRIDPVRALRDG
jgi:putative ABC transport system permease protein